MTPDDDYLHTPGADPAFSESMYFHFYDPRARLGGFLRIGNRPNEGHGEVTVCLYLPDGRLGFAYEQPRVTSNDRLDAAGMRVEVREPMRHLELAFDGNVTVVDDPTMMTDPRAALGGSPVRDCSLALSVYAIAPESEHSFDADDVSFVPNHYEQPIAVDGRIRLAGDATTIHGHGLRDHTWGPRSWQAPWFYRWVHGCTDGFGFMGAWFGRQDGSAIRGGFVWDGRVQHRVTAIDLGTVRDDRDEQVEVDVVLRSAAREWKLHGRARATVPLRHRPTDDTTGRVSMTRIVESLMTWTLHDGRELYGMSEYLDQIVDGRPVGLEV
ncbi:hypothetical protein H0B56_14935 [Haloechinothrix sp. YIM 98757]|uniref:Tocopherol cyclase n=1 Tax=Haloechinothrix aidingensis TaxID=2752311 RepID=A0A838AC60_9PSEU|nr:hypothetical protein [Haloechinothrix aidingensis]MBA0126844.1 hypothetical protein [Haloechinothrix aidingensis]